VTNFEVTSVKGLKPLASALKKVGPEAPKGLRIALNSVAEIVVKAAVPLVPRKSGAAAKSIKVKSTRTSARIAAGGSRVPYYPWLDFGGKVGRHKSVVRDFYRSGRYIYPTIAKKQVDIQKALEKALADVVTAAGLEVKS
jgi:hypothetical protein